MAGGMGKPGGIPLGDRTRVDPRRPIEQLHATPYRQPQHTGPDPRTYGETAKYRDLEPVHVVVLTDAGWNPGLLVAWRKPHQLPWEGLVHHGRLVDGRWVVAREWLPAGAITEVVGAAV